MKKLKSLITCIVFISLFGCKSEVNGIFYVSNGSEQNAEVPLRLMIDTDTIFNQKAKYTNIRPDLQYVERKKLTKGKHEIIFEVVGTELKKVENVEFDKDKWIFLSYRLNRYEEPSLIFHVMENEPQHK
jgi:hypothetical protein